MYNFVSTLNEELLVESYIGSKYQESLQQCIVHKSIAKNL